MKLLIFTIDHCNAARMLSIAHIMEFSQVLHSLFLMEQSFAPQISWWAGGAEQSTSVPPPKIQNSFSSNHSTPIDDNGHHVMRSSRHPKASRQGQNSSSSLFNPINGLRFPIPQSPWRSRMCRMTSLTRRPRLHWSAWAAASSLPPSRMPCRSATWAL